MKDEFDELDKLNCKFGELDGISSMSWKLNKFDELDELKDEFDELAKLNCKFGEFDKLNYKLELER